MEFQTDYEKTAKRAWDIHSKQQSRRFMSEVRSGKHTTYGQALEHVRRTPTYVFKATIAGKRGYVIMSDREMKAAGLKPEKAGFAWGLETGSSKGGSQ
ncbi:hypothetical protein [Sporomusa sp. KB1]|jgi:hypothetical protein|uniref:hypothetical protein n=1 Tax=Sporomusa sp. KB1 TaxID=943346 RepID=UPI00119D1288|nr:hypothetical protein [Sporomusa sp. KB1]TWH45919.1 hypothetical protein Salpa_1851 [Sporomusa sp. KB1]